MPEGSKKIYAESQIWSYKIMEGDLKKSAHPVPRRLVAIIQARGGPTRPCVDNFTSWKYIKQIKERIKQENDTLFEIEEG
ncbi:hypothetical protein DSO57_1031979 [Entomophthora muscae]|uniref:Uncharacterized protein n=1 Tax=Entomophthora muscae TaxID=34485 RepID=A0ACC2UA85_9FUNG|nr:hypothetical protein DSO57_1031979 [Entomophthora muscae]